MRTRAFRAAALFAALVPLAGLAGEPKPAPTTPAKAAPVFDPDALGRMEIAAKKFACEQSNRRMIVVFGTNDCAKCRVVTDTLNEPKFQAALMRQFIPAFVDVSPGSPNLDILKDWHIDPAKGFPAVAILDEKGTLAEATQDGEMVHEAAKGSAAVQAWFLKRFIADN